MSASKATPSYEVVAIRGDCHSGGSLHTAPGAHLAATMMLNSNNSPADVQGLEHQHVHCIFTQKKKFYSCWACAQAGKDHKCPQIIQ
jgi:hypothetical protein